MSGTGVNGSGAMPYKQKIVLLILGCAAIRWIVAATTELGNDEAYYWLYSQHLQWNYFDHPPMVALWIRFFTANLSLDAYEGFIRLGSVVSGAFSTLFLYKAGKVIHSERAGWLAACLFNTSFYASITASIYILPDSPQVLFWTFCLWMLARITKNETGWANWILFGIGAGLCIMSKVHGVFVWGGLGLFILFKKRDWLAKPQVYVAGILTLILISPILVWNFDNDFVTFRFHSQRVTVKQDVINWYSFLGELFGQLCNNNPLTVMLSFIALAGLYQHKIKRHPALSIYNFIAVPFAGLLLCISMFRNTLPHWSGPAYVSFLPVAGIWLAEHTKKIYRHFFRISLSLFLAVLLGGALVVHFYPGNFGSKKEEDLGKGDMTLDMYGWKEAGRQFKKIYETEIAKGNASANTPLVCHRWWGAHVEYYFCRPAGAEMIGLTSLYNIHQYWWMNKLRSGVNMDTAYCIMPSDEYFFVPYYYAPYYRKIDLVSTIKIYRNGKPAHNFFVYRLSEWKMVQGIPMVSSLPIDGLPGF
jgi:hypothetical protein